MRFENTPFYYDLIGRQFEIITGGTPSTKNNNYWKGDIPWMPSGDINKKYIFDVSKSISELGLTNSSAKMAPYHSVLIALAGQGKTRGTSAILEINSCINQSLAAILPNNKFNPYYVFHYLESKYDDLRLISSGDGGRGGLNKELISNYKISYPTLSEQNKIAEFLNKIDERIQTQIKIIEDYTSLNKCIVNELIINLDEYTECFISDIAEIGRGRVINSKEISKQLNPIYPVYSSQTSNNGVMGYLDKYEFDGEYITWTTDGANAGTVYYRNGKFNCTNVCGILKINEQNDAFFISKLLSRATSAHVSKNLANPKLMNNVMAKIKIKLPSLDKQREFSKIIRSIESRIQYEKELLNLLESQKTYLLKNLFI